MAADLERLVLNLHTLGEIRVARSYPAAPDPVTGPWKLKSGRISPFYISGRDLTGFSNELPLPISEQLATRELAVTALAELLDGHEAEYNHLYGLPQAGTPIASLVAGQRRESFLWGRVGTKDHGVQSPTQGHYAKNDKVAGIDNVVTAAESALAEADKLEKLGLVMSSLFVLVDREEEGRDVLGGHYPPIELYGAIGASAAVAILGKSKRITPRQQEFIDGYYRELHAQ